MVQPVTTLAQSTRWAVLDFETTSLDDPHPVEVGLVRGDGVVLLDTLVRPAVPVGEGARAVHGISDAELATAPAWPEVRAQLVEALRGIDLLVAYRIDFERRVLRTVAAHYGLACPAAAVAWYDAHHPPEGREHWSQDSARASLGLVEPVPHRAVGDCHATLELMQARGDRMRVDVLMGA